MLLNVTVSRPRGCSGRRIGRSTCPSALSALGLLWVRSGSARCPLRRSPRLVPVAGAVGGQQVGLAPAGLEQNGGGHSTSLLAGHVQALSRRIQIDFQGALGAIKALKCTQKCKPKGSSGRSKQAAPLPGSGGGFGI